MREKRQALILTVGTGDVAKPQETLLFPLTKSMRHGAWSRIVLLPSQVTAETASRLRQDLHDLPIEVCPLPQEKAENNADACFAFFDEVIGKLRSAGWTSDQLRVDYTRGTKAMGAALVLAAVRHGIPELRYISGERDQRGMVKPGTEVVSEFRTAEVSARLRFDDALAFCQRGNFAAVLELLPEPSAGCVQDWPEGLRALAGYGRSLAAFYAAWDRFDYVGAAAAAATPAPRPSEWDRFTPAPEARQWVADLAQPMPQPMPQRVLYLRRLAADLFANGERRLRDHLFEDALVRAYRVLEMLGYARFCEQTSHEAAEDMLKRNRNEVLAHLKNVRDPLALKLQKAADRGQVKATDRHVSLLTHGGQASAAGNGNALVHLYRDLEKLLKEDAPGDAERHLLLARSMSF